MDNQTRQALKQDNFITVTKGGLHWAGENRRSVIVTAIILLAVIVIAVGSVGIYNYRSTKAEALFGNAMLAYEAPLQIPGQTLPPGTKSYPTTIDRAKAANALFTEIVSKYGSTPAGKNARYFAGLTYIEAGQNSSAESTLKEVADGMDKNLSVLSKSALASLYHQTGRDSQAIDEYNQIIAKPADTVTAGMAKLQLAALYDATGKTDDAKKLYAQLKDQDAKGAAGQLAAQKLNPAPAMPQQ